MKDNEIWNVFKENRVCPKCGCKNGFLYMTSYQDPIYEIQCCNCKAHLYINFKDGVGSYIVKDKDYVNYENVIENKSEMMFSEIYDLVRENL